MSKKKYEVAVFTANIQAPNGVQPAIAIVQIPTGVKTWQHVVISFDETTDPKTIHVHQTNMDTTNIENVVTMFGKYSLVFENTTLIPQNITLTNKIDATLRLKNVNINSINLDTSDYLASGSTLEVYLTSTFTVDPKVLHYQVQTTQVAKVAYPYDDVDWWKTWDSPFLTDVEKEQLRPDFDADIALLNSHRDAAKILDKVLTTKTFDKKYTLIGLHGNPGSGKTQAVIEWCRIHNAPLFCIPGDAMMTLQKVLAETAPQNRNALLSQPDVAQSIEALKIKIQLLLQISNDLEKQLSNSGITDNDRQRLTNDLLNNNKQVKEVTDMLESLSRLSEPVADLVKSKSIVMKCAEHNLPLIVSIDELNLTPVNFQNSLAAVISDGIIKDGPHIVNSHFCIKWIYSWNPNTTCTKSWDQKFYDRSRYIQFEDLPIDLTIQYRKNKTILGMQTFTGNAMDLSVLYQKLDLATNKCPEHTRYFEYLKNLIGSAHNSYKSLEWLVDSQIERVTHQGYIDLKDDTFNFAYLNNVAVGSPQETGEAIEDLTQLVQLINNELYVETVGKDSKNPDRNSSFYISNRNIDQFIDCVFCYRSVSKAVKRYIYDLIPGGNTLRSGRGVADKSSFDDDTPITIANTIADKLSGEIATINTKLFVDISTSAMDQTEQDLKDAQYDSNLWQVATTNASTTGSKTTTSLEEAESESMVRWTD